MACRIAAEPGTHERPGHRSAYGPAGCGLVRARTPRSLRPLGPRQHAGSRGVLAARRGTVRPAEMPIGRRGGLPPIRVDVRPPRLGPAWPRPPRGPRRDALRGSHGQAPRGLRDVSDPALRPLNRVVTVSTRSRRRVGGGAARRGPGGGPLLLPVRLASSGLPRLHRRGSPLPAGVLAASPVARAMGALP